MERHVINEGTEKERHNDEESAEREEKRGREELSPAGENRTQTEAGEVLQQGGMV